MATTKLAELRHRLLAPGLTDFNQGVDLYERIRRHLDPAEQEGLGALIILTRVTNFQKYFSTHRQPTAAERAAAVQAAFRAFAAFKTEKIVLPPWGVEVLPEEIGHFACTDLRLSRNPLTALPEALGKLAALRLLYADETRLSALPASFGALRLSDLSLSGCQFSQFPAEILAISGLTLLDLSRNPLGQVPDTLVDLTQLQWLSLHRTAITELPPGMERLTQLKTLHLGSTPLGQSAQLEALRRTLPWCEVTLH